MLTFKTDGHSPLDCCKTIVMNSIPSLNCVWYKVKWWRVNNLESYVILFFQKEVLAWLKNQLLTILVRDMQLS